MTVFNNRDLRLIFIGGKILVSLVHTESKCLFADPKVSMEVRVIFKGSLSCRVAHDTLLLTRTNA